MCKCKDGEESQVTERSYNIDMNNIVKHIEELIKQYQAEEKDARRADRCYTTDAVNRSEGRADQLEDVVMDLKKIVQMVTSEYGE